MILPAALSGTFLCLKHFCLSVLRTLPFFRSLSHVPWLMGRRFRPTSGHLESTSMFVYYDSTATISTIGPRVEYVDNHRNYRSKSGICCRVQTSFLRVDGCCCISVHVPTSFCSCELQPVVLGDEKCQSLFYDITTRMLCFVLQDN